MASITSESSMTQVDGGRGPAPRNVGVGKGALAACSVVATSSVRPIADYECHEGAGAILAMGAIHDRRKGAWSRDRVSRGRPRRARDRRARERTRRGWSHVCGWEVVVPNLDRATTWRSPMESGAFVVP